MNVYCYIFIVPLFCQSLMAQSNSQDDMLKYNRSAIIIQGIERLRRNSEQALISEALSPTAPRDSRIAAAILLIREHQSQPAIDAALEAMSLDMPAGINEWESAGDWRLEYPVAAEAALHAGLMEKIIWRAVDGRLPESAVAFLLLSYQTENHGPRVHLDALLKTNLSPEQRQRAKRLVAILKGEYLNDPPIAESVKEPTSPPPTCCCATISEEYRN